jgi:hypothetical protein
MTEENKRRVSFSGRLSSLAKEMPVLRDSNSQSRRTGISFASPSSDLLRRVEDEARKQEIGALVRFSII